MRPTFEKTVDILVKAYLNDTLVHGYCAACAVGNIIAHANKIKITIDCGAPRWVGTKMFPEWDEVFYTGAHPTDADAQVIVMDGYRGGAKEQIDSTGYSVVELAKIEKSFEAHNPSYFIDYPTQKDMEQWMFNGLMAVVDVLAEIHGIDLKQREEAKLLFVK